MVDVEAEVVDVEEVEEVVVDVEEVVEVVVIGKEEVVVVIGKEEEEIGMEVVEVGKESNKEVGKGHNNVHNKDKDQNVQQKLKIL
jgi:hypothetical protein